MRILKRETEFLGHVITEKGIKPNSKKIEAIKNYVVPRNQKNKSIPRIVRLL